jgi:putative endonuclease
MYYVYVLKSISSGRFYKGFCSNISHRLSEHNAGKTKSTKPFIPWELVYFEEFESQAEAIRREKYFKSAAGRKFLSKVI